MGWEISQVVLGLKHIPTNVEECQGISFNTPKWIHQNKIWFSH
jgi:hypothetical protein